MSLAAVTGAALAGVGAAHAAQVESAAYGLGTHLYFEAAAGEVNNLTVKQSHGRVTFTDLGATINAGEKCTGSAHVVTCSVENVAVIQIILGDGNDRATVDTHELTYVNGQSGDDYLRATGPRAQLYGDDGDDTMRTGRGDDLVAPGPGVNTVGTGGGNDVVTAGLGADSVRLGSGDDQVYVGSGKDDVHGGPGTDSVHFGIDQYYYGGYSGGDQVVSLDNVANDGDAHSGMQDNVHSDIENVYTGTGNDTITGSARNNLLNGGTGRDTVQGAAGRDSLFGDRGHDRLSGGAANDFLSSGAGNDVVRGGVGDDRLAGDDTEGNDVFAGGKGIDLLEVFSDTNVSVSLDNRANDGQRGERDNVKSDVEDVRTGMGNDTIVGSKSPNELSGGGGNDTVRGGGGNDGVDGGDGRDTLGGGSGTDSVAGGGGTDRISSQDGSADYVTCGSSVDSVNRDKKDQVAVDCERLR